MQKPHEQPGPSPSVTLYDRYGRPVQVNPQHITQPQPHAQPQPHHQPQSQQVYPHDEKQVNAQSHVTQAQQYAPGANFDPQIRSQYANEPNVVHATRPVEPHQFPISDELQRLSEESRKKYPTVNLSEGEHIILEVRRHPIGLMIPVLVSGFIIIVLLGVLVSVPFLNENLLGLVLDPLLAAAVIIPMILLVAIFGYIAVWVYTQNRLLLTNESIIQEIQLSLFSKHEQTVSLGSVEDASYVQKGVIQSMMNYGTIRMSTEGEETTYRFHYVSNPKKQVSALTNAVEAFKNGRPVTPELID